MKNLKNPSILRSVLALGLFGVAAPSHAFFNDAETKAFCLAETIVSLFAVLADHSGTCPSLSGDVSMDGVGGTAEVVTAGGTLGLTARLEGSSVRGVFCNVTADGALIGSTVSSYKGYLPRQKPLTSMTHAWNKGRTIMKSGATVKIDGIEFYDEHNIKNFRKHPRKDVFFDHGLEVITKFGYPRAKWEQDSKYIRSNGVIDAGRLYVDKDQITPQLPCGIDLDLIVDNPGGSFDASGTVSVSPENDTR